MKVKVRCSACSTRRKVCNSDARGNLFPSISKMERDPSLMKVEQGLKLGKLKL